MNPKERLDAIAQENLMSGGDRDIDWMIDRIRKLTETLENILEHDLHCGVNSCGHSQIDVMATKALEDDDN